MLKLSKFIGKGESRICFEHPDNRNKCVKVSVRHKESHLLEKELKNSLKIKPYLGDFILNYEKKLVDTDQGVGLVCELLRDDNGECSKALAYYLARGEFDDELKKQVWRFYYNLLAHDVFVYDFNLGNFMVQIKNGRKYLKYTDLKSFENCKSWTFLKLERVFPFLAHFIMHRRLKKFFSVIGLSTHK